MNMPGIGRLERELERASKKTSQNKTISPLKHPNLLPQKI